MKLKTLIVSSILLLTLGICKAQNPKNYYIEDPKTFVGGLVGGVNFTQVDGDSYKGYHNKALVGGVVVYTFFKPNVAASLEILYAQKGAKSKGAQLSTNGLTLITKQNIMLNYAEIPIQLNIFDKKRNHFGGGFSYSQLINSKEVVEGTNKNVVYDQTLYPFKKMDINLVLSGQVQVFKGLYAGLRFQYSLVSIRNKVDPEFGRQQQFNNVFSLRLMYLFF